MATMTKDEFITEVSKVLAGLQVQRSINGAMMLGAAMEPWDNIHRGLMGFGWHNAEDYEKAIRELDGNMDEVLLLFTTPDQVPALRKHMMTDAPFYAALRIIEIMRHKLEEAKVT